jgi:Uma2 family endonuclease
MMADPAEKRWTVEDFLVWNDGTDRRHELVDGQLVAMAPRGACGNRDQPWRGAA